jgi:uncharacterized membrane protein
VGSAGGVVGETWELTWGLGVTGVGVGAAPVSTHGGAGARRPLELDSGEEECTTRARCNTRSPRGS